MPVDNRVEPLWDLSLVPVWAIVVILIVLIVAFVVGLFLAICGITALRGWQSYASRHRGPNEFPSNVQIFTGQSMMIGGNIAPANYRHVITAGLGDAGIHLRMGSMFRAFHPALLVPWDAIENVSQKAAVIGHYTAVECRSLPRLVFFKALGDAVRDRWVARAKQTEPSGIGR